MAGKKTVEQLQDENLELKLLDIRKDIINSNKINEDQHRQITERLVEIAKDVCETLEHARETNGSVAAVKEDVIYLKACKDANAANIELLKKETAVYRWFSTHPKIFKYAIYIIVILAAIGGGENVWIAIKSLLF